MELYDTIVAPGGATKGFILLGCIQYLYDRSLLDLKHFIGTSSASMILFLIAIGYTPIEILVWLTNNKVIDNLSSKFNSITEIINDNGIYDFGVITDCLNKMCKEKIGVESPTLLELYEVYGKILEVSTCNLTLGKVEYISYKNKPNLSCLDAIRMSSNLPFIFGKFIVDDEEYIDGGILDNFPIDNISDCNKKVIAINYEIDTLYQNKGDAQTNNLKILIDKMYRILNLSINVREKDKNIKTYDPRVNLIVLNVSQINFLNLYLESKQKVEMFSTGYNAAKEFYTKNNL